MAALNAAMNDATQSEVIKSGVRAAISFHGSVQYVAGGNRSVPIQVGVYSGTRDDSIENIANFETALAKRNATQYELVRYSDAYHAFTVRKYL